MTQETPDGITEVSVQELMRMGFRKQNELAAGLEKGKKVDDESLEEALLIQLTSGEYSASIRLILSELGLVKSRGEAKRLIDQGAIQVIHEGGGKTTVSDDRPLIRVGDVIRVGKRRFVKIVGADRET